MPKTATDTGNKITSGYALVIDNIEEYFETIQGAVNWAKEGNINDVVFFTDPSITDQEKADDLLYGDGMIHSDNL
jgi:hypothetical protein